MEVEWWWWCGHHINGLWFAQQSRMFRFLYFRWLCSFMPAYEAANVLSVNVKTNNLLNGETFWTVEMTALRRTMNGAVTLHDDPWPNYYVTTYIITKPPPCIEPDEKDAEKEWTAYSPTSKIYTYEMTVVTHANGITIKASGSNDNWDKVGAPPGCWMFSLHRMRELDHNDLYQRTNDEHLTMVKPGRAVDILPYQLPQYVLPTFGDHAPQLAWPQRAQEKLMIEAYEYQERALPDRINVTWEPHALRRQDFAAEIINSQLVTIDAYKKLAFKPIDPNTEHSDRLTRAVEEQERYRSVESLRAKQGRRYPPIFIP